VLGEGTLGYKVTLLLYRVCLVKAPWVRNNADNIQGVLGEGTLGYKVTLLLYRVCLVKAPWVTRLC